MENRQLIQRNDVIAYYPHAWYGRVVTNLSGKYSHISITASDTLEFTTLPFTGVHFRDIEFSRNFDVFRLKPEFEPLLNETAAWHWANELANQIPKVKYDYLGLIAYLFKWPVLNLPNRYYCNELIDQFFRTGSLALCPNKLPWQCSPTDITNSNLLVQVFTTS